MHNQGDSTQPTMFCSSSLLGIGFGRVLGDFPLVSLSFLKLKFHFPIGKGFHSIVVVRSLRKRKVASSILAGSSGVKGCTNSYPGFVI